VITIKSASNGYILSTDDPDSQPEVFEELEFTLNSDGDMDALIAIRRLLWGVMEALGKSPSRKRLHLRIDMYDEDGNFVEKV